MIAPPETTLNKEEIHYQIPPVQNPKIAALDLHKEM